MKTDNTPLVREDAAKLVHERAVTMRDKLRRLVEQTAEYWRASGDAGAAESLARETNYYHGYAAALRDLGIKVD